ncbi:hypothetical protein JB92DRAFT_2825599 [Gautieria morchelliformis]|nr:hypothetical protein JB92DRAFT_2825599 [Gautieria morchelliformis]
MAVPSPHSSESFHLKLQRKPPFYALDDELPLLLVVASGLQHALAVLADLITSPITSAYLISTLLILREWRVPPPAGYSSNATIGILGLVQMSRLKRFGGYYLGTGLISVVVGNSFLTLSTPNYIFGAMCSDGTCSSTTLSDGTVVLHACSEAYDKLSSGSAKPRVYAPAVPKSFLGQCLLYTLMAIALVAMGDVPVTTELSHVNIRGVEFDSRIQGSILSDGLGGFFSALFTVTTPLSVFAQPWKVFGCSLPVSGVRVLAFIKFTRRDRFVLAAAPSVGLGDHLAREIFTNEDTTKGTENNTNKTTRA